ncbi:MAG: ATP-dependent protease ATPase subunit HslU [Sumerlaeia bacterium]
MSGFTANDLTPRQIVAELDKFIVGQKRAKRVVAIALRNRARRRQLNDDLRNEVSPKNILMMGPTGVGKTEIARRLARLARAPFVKVEATKYTEVGYVGRDVESMVRDLVEVSIKLVREEKTADVREAVEDFVADRLLDLLTPPPAGVTASKRMVAGKPEMNYSWPDESSHPAHEWWRKREVLKGQMADGKLDDREVDVKVTERPPNPMAGMGGGMDPSMGGGMMMDLSGLFDQLNKMTPKKTKSVRMRVGEARRILFEEETEGLLDMDKIKAEALDRAQNDGIIFIDEFDKIAGGRGGERIGADVSREGVQRDILPIVEGSTVQTKHGMITTDHVLFIAAGAFHVSKPSDLIPELQGRFPLRVELEALSAEDFRRILTEPDNALTKQYAALLATEGVELEWQPDGIEELAESAAKVNSTTENIGARRLHTILEKMLEDVSFEAPDMGVGRITINRAFVRQTLHDIVEDQDLSRYIL